MYNKNINKCLNRSESIIEYFYLIISAVSGCAKSTFSKWLSPYSASPSSFGITHSMLCMAAALVLFVLNGGNIDLSMRLSLILGTMFGICTTVAQFLYMRAFAYGKVPVVTFIYSCGFLIPTAAGTIFWAERISAVTIFGCIILLAAFFLCIRRDPQSNGDRNIPKRGKRRIIYPFAAMFCSGMLGILQKVHQSSVEQDATGTFLCTAFGVAVLLSLGIAIVTRPKCDIKSEKTVTRKVQVRWICFSALSGVFIGIANYVNLLLAGRLPAAIMFPVTNGGVVFLSAIVGRVVFREKLSKRAYAGILLGLAAIVVIGLGK